MTCPSAALSTRRQLYYTRETKHNDNLESPLRGRLHHCDTHVQNWYSELPPPSYREMDTGYHNNCSMSNFLGSQEPIRQKD